jgi:D-beta-D-heptose 7-phosphate kinase/D-beta-D-heptose 1-phosphate adenosyltransferase
MNPSKSRSFVIKRNTPKNVLSPRRLLQWVEKFESVPILVVGDLMVDRSYGGSAERISPEAPVPVVHVQSQWMSPGGSGNVASNLATLGARPTLIAVRGDDISGSEVHAELIRRGVNARGILIDSDPSWPTITKTRVFAGHQQVARFDLEKRGSFGPEILGRITRLLKELIPHNKAVIISDYGKGLITPSVIKTSIKEAQRKKTPVLVDPKIEHFLQYKGVECITPNTKEAVEGLRALPLKTEEDFLELGGKILGRLRLRSLLITRGEKGVTLFQPQKPPVTISAVAQKVYDVTGAGDTVIATFGLARAVGASYVEAAQLANLAAGLVVAKVGTAAVTRDELIQRIRNL